jgi:ribulose-bisphosphate carboxylase large chain
MNDETVKGMSCDWIPGGEPTASAAEISGAASGNRSVIYPFAGDFTWTGVPQERYKAEDGTWAAIARTVLIGARGESALFDLRYFEIAPGGHSSLEKHEHEHVVICIRGSGTLLIDGALAELNFLDTAYLAPNDPHQLCNPFAEPFGFFCIVNHLRDRPRPPDEKELGALLSGAAAGGIHP